MAGLEVLAEVRRDNAVAEAEETSLDFALRTLEMEDGADGLRVA